MKCYISPKKETNFLSFFSYFFVVYILQLFLSINALLQRNNKNKIKTNIHII